MDDYLDGYFNLNYATDVPVAGLKRWGINDPSQVGVRKTLVPDPTSASGEGRMVGYQFYNKVTGEPVGLDGSGYLGEGPSLGVDKSGKIIGVNPTPNDGFFGGLVEGIKGIVTNPAVKYIGSVALLGNAAAGLGAGAAGAGAAGTTTAEAAMADLLAQEAASGGLGSLAAAATPTAESAMADLLAQETASGGLGSLAAATPTAESAMADVLAQEAAAGAGTTSAEAAMADLMSTETANAASKLPVNALAKLALLGAGAGGVKSLIDQQTGGGGPTAVEGGGPLSGYTFDPSQFRAMTPDPAMFRPGSEVTTVADVARRGYAQGGSTKPTFTPKAKLAAMDPWSRAQAELNNAAYMGRMPRAMGMPQAGIAQLGQFAQGGVTGDGSLNLHIPLEFGGSAGFGGGFGGSVGGGFGSSGMGLPGLANTSGGSSFAGYNNASGGGFGTPSTTLYSQGTTVQGAPLGSTVASPLTPEQRSYADRFMEDERHYGNTINMQNQGSTTVPSGPLYRFAAGGMPSAPYNLGGYSDGGRLLRGPGDGVSDSIPATIGDKQPARLANNEFVIPARIVSEIGNGSTEAGARKLYAMMDRVQNARKKTVGKDNVAVDSKAYKALDAL